MEVKVPENHVTYTRRRKKQLYQEIRNQMEFYFSIPNLSRDRFLGKLLKDNRSTPVEISVFLQFNKIRALTTRVKDIVKALKSSTMLSVTDYGTHVFCKDQCAITESAEDCILYIENIPLEVDHEWLSEILSIYGKVVYVSLPRYKPSQKLKGFGFVEFENVESAKKALDAYEYVGCRLPSDLGPNNQCSVISFDSGKDEQDTGEVPPPDVCEKRGNTAQQPSNVHVQQHVMPLKRKIVACEEETQACKKIKVDVHEKELSKAENEENVENGLKLDSKEVKKKTRNRQRKNRNKTKKKRQEKMSIESYGLQIMSKAEWKKLRNDYLNLQRNSMGNPRYKGAQDFNTFYNMITLEEGFATEELDDEAKMKEISSVFEFTHGVIVHAQLDLPIEEVSSFKASARSLGEVKHVDVHSGDLDGYIRCSNPEVAQDMISKALFPHMKILEGTDEISYWYKMVKDRELTQKQKVTQKEKKTARTIKANATKNV